MEGALEARTLEGAVEERAQLSAFEGLALERALGLSQRRPAGLPQELQAGLPQEQPAVVSERGQRRT